MQFFNNLVRSSNNRSVTCLLQRVPYEFMVGESQVSFRADKFTLYKKAVFPIFLFIAVGIILTLMGIADSNWFFLGSFFALFFAWLFGQDFLLLRENTKGKYFVDLMLIDNEGIYKAGAKSAKQYFYSWSEVDKIVQVDCLLQVDRDYHSEELFAPNKKSRANDVLLNLDLPTDQFAATTDALKRFSAGKVSFQRFKTANFNHIKGTAEYLT